MITKTEDIALEHIAYRRSQGWGYQEIEDEALYCLIWSGLKLRPVDTMSRLIQAYAACNGVVHNERD